MTEVERMLDQYDRALNGNAWHGDPVWKILDGISAKQAGRGVETQAHTIWQLVAHMTFWETEVWRRLRGLPPRALDELNFPAAPEASEESWQRTLAEFRRSNEDFRKALSQLDPWRLDEPLPGREKSGYTAYAELHGVIQHNIYHAGQIAILRKFVVSN
jgi:uncharacterized damage-inducible protein DinB